MCTIHNFIFLDCFVPRNDETEKFHVEHCLFLTPTPLQKRGELVLSFLYFDRFRMTGEEANECLKSVFYSLFSILSITVPRGTSLFFRLLWNASALSLLQFY